MIESGAQLGLGVFSVDRIKHNGDPISSTRIRKELESGGIEAANALFGYNYYSTGVVIGGAKLGRTLGFPTLNLPWQPECRPCYGVYFVRFRSSQDAPWQPAVANYGIKPTVASVDQSPALEVHALNGTQLGEGDTIEVQWLHFLRAEQKFASVDALKAQIAKDCETAGKLAQL